MSSGVTTPNRLKSRQPQPIENVEEEFSKRMMQLFTSFYESPTADPIITFPPVAKKKGTKDENKDTQKESATQQPPFNAAVWDLRLKKAVEARQNSEQATTEAMTENTINALDVSSIKVADLTEVFQPEKVERPEVPRYIQNLETDEINIIKEKKNRKKPKALNLTEVEKQYKQRQIKLKEREQAHQKKLRDWQLKQERTHREFLNSLPKSKFSEANMAQTKAENKARMELMNSRRSAQSSPRGRSKSPAATSKKTPITSPSIRSKSPSPSIRSRSPIGSPRSQVIESSEYSE